MVGRASREDVAEDVAAVVTGVERGASGRVLRNPRERLGLVSFKVDRWTRGHLAKRQRITADRKEERSTISPETCHYIVCNLKVNVPLTLWRLTLRQTERHKN